MATTENLHTGDASKTKFSFIFPYLNQTDVEVYVYATNAWVKKTIITHYTFDNATTIKFDSSHVPPAATTAEQALLGNTKNIKIKRNTSGDSLAATFYPGSAIRSGDLNDNYTQNLYVTQEASNAVTNANTDAAAAVVTADTAKATADDAADDVKRWIKDGDGSDTAGDEDDADFTARPLKPQGVPYAVARSTTAINDSSSALTKANEAIADSASATTTANTARDNAVKQSGVTPPGGANAAITIAEDAYDNAVKQSGVTPSGGSNAAINIAESASTTATTAKTAVDTYVHDGTSLKGDGIGSNPKGVAYAVTTAESAQSAVAASGLYTVVTNFAALPALTDSSLDASDTNSLLYQVSDSTGIESQSTLNGEPASFVGDDELTVKLKANITSSPKVWEWQEYYATDPETRYRKKLVVENLRTISENYTIGVDNNAFSIGPVTISSGKTITIPANSKYVVMN